MLNRFGFAINYALGRDIGGRAVVRFADDNFLIAYPGSGGQWLRRLVGNIIEPGSPVTEGNICQRVPSLYEMSRRGLLKVPRPRIIFSHESFDSDCRNKVVYMIRDPRDVAVSIYNCHGAHARDHLAGVEEFVSTYFMRTDQYQGGWAEDFSGSIRQEGGFFYRIRLRDEFLGTPASWGESVMSWVGARGHDPNGLLRIRYEDLLLDAETVLSSICEYLKLLRTPNQIRDAVRASHAVATPEEPGAWKGKLPSSCVQEIEAVWGFVMSLCGYPPAQQMDLLCANTRAGI